MSAAPRVMPLSSLERSVRLVTAAPALYEALRALVERYEFDGVPNDSAPYVAAARAALAKAEGA
ncbi:MAG: hypothetical protein IT518_20650 [Burkholderiales bacterium]|nr:hypothetical protein [Burkholderiales bacterium]